MVTSDSQPDAEWGGRKAVDGILRNHAMQIAEKKLFFQNRGLRCLHRPEIRTRSRALQLTINHWTPHPPHTNVELLHGLLLESCEWAIATFSYLWNRVDGGSSSRTVSQWALEITRERSRWKLTLGKCRQRWTLPLKTIPSRNPLFLLETTSPPPARLRDITTTWTTVTGGMLPRGWRGKIPLFDPVLICNFTAGMRNQMRQIKLMTSRIISKVEAELSLTNTDSLRGR